ncbi:hypothetical protein APU18_26035 [Escherichia coli]|nr:hypothetical protein APU18_26035 [Escherichia coli]
MQASNKVYFTRIQQHIGTMLTTIAGKACVRMFKPWALRVVFWMVLHGTTTQMAAIAVVRGSLRSTGGGQAAITVKSHEGFGVHSIHDICALPPDDTQASAVPVRAAWSESEWRVSKELPKGE